MNEAPAPPAAAPDLAVETALTRGWQMNHVVSRSLVQPHAPIVTLFQHLNPRFACGESSALGDALDIGVVDDRRELAADNFSSAYEVDPRFTLLTGDWSDGIGRKSHLIGTRRKALAVRHKASSDLDGAQQRR